MNLSRCSKLIFSLPTLYCSNCCAIFSQYVYTLMMSMNFTDFLCNPCLRKQSRRRCWRRNAVIRAPEHAAAAYMTSITVYKSTPQYQSTRETKIGGAVPPFSYSWALEEGVIICLTSGTSSHYFVICSQKICN